MLIWSVKPSESLKQLLCRHWVCFISCHRPRHCHLWRPSTNTWTKPSSRGSWREPSTMTTITGSTSDRWVWRRRLHCSHCICKEPNTFVLPQTVSSHLTQVLYVFSSGCKVLSTTSLWTYATCVSICGSHFNVYCIFYCYCFFGNKDGGVGNFDGLNA